MNARDLMKGLLNRQPANRLGAGPNDYLDIKVTSMKIYDLILQLLFRHLPGLQKSTLRNYSRVSSNRHMCLNFAVKTTLNYSMSFLRASPLWTRPVSQDFKLTKICF